MRGPLLRIFRTFSAIIETGKICFCFLLGQYEPTTDSRLKLYVPSGKGFKDVTEACHQNRYINFRV